MLLDIFAFLVGAVVLCAMAIGCIVVACILTCILICVVEKAVNWFKKNFRMW